jgi:RNase P subunit RPR2
MLIKLYQVANKWQKVEPDFTGLELDVYIRENYKAYCPKCNSILSFDENDRSNMDYIGACLDCDEDFYAVECDYEESENV